METSTLFYLLAAAMVLVGIAGTVLPALPGVPLVFAGLLLAAWADGFDKVGALPLVVLGMALKLALIFTMLAVFALAWWIG